MGWLFLVVGVGCNYCLHVFRGANHNYCTGCGLFKNSGYNLDEKKKVYPQESVGATANITADQLQDNNEQ